MSNPVRCLSIVLLVPGMLCCVSSATRSETSDVVEPSCALLLHLTESHYRATEPINGRLTVRNTGQEPIVIVKPMLPTAWSVRFAPEQSSIDTARVWEGSVLRGTSDPGYEPGYGTSNYVTIESGKEYEQALDVAWFLRNQRSAIPLGVYDLRVWYRYDPQLAELSRHPGMFPAEIGSNVLRVVIIGEAE